MSIESNKIVWEEIEEKTAILLQNCRAANELKENYPGGSIQLILDNLPENTPSHYRNWFLNLKKKSDRYNVKNTKLDEHQEKTKRELISLIDEIYDYIVKNKKFFISQIEENFELDKNQRFVLNGALSIFGKKTVKTYLSKFIKEQEDTAKFISESYDSILKIVKSNDSKCLWENLGLNICGLYLKRKGEVQQEEIVGVIASNEYSNLPNKINDINKVEKEYLAKIKHLEQQEKYLQEEKEKMEEKMKSLNDIEEKYSNLLKELEEKNSKLVSKEVSKDEPEKVTGSLTMDPIYDSIEEPKEPVMEVEPKIENIEGFSATESAVIRHMEEVLRHKKGTQNIWIDDELDKEHTFLSSEKISRGSRIITDKKEILDYYKESRNIEKI